MDRCGVASRARAHRADEPAVTDHDRPDPFAPVEASPRFATAFAVVGFALALAAVLTRLEVLAGPLGMAAGLVAHVKGSRLGMPAAIVAGVAMIVGMSVTFWLR
jgi:CBS-domain-containing membrane protein